MMGDESKPVSNAPAQGIRAGARSAPPLRVYLLAGLPTEAVRWGFERACELLPIVPLDALADIVLEAVPRIGVLLPPFVEPSLIVESWEQCDFLSDRFGRPARVAGVSTFVDVDQVLRQLTSADPLSRHGWARGRLDGRTVADILVGQIESATHLALVGTGSGQDPLDRCLAALNPTASRSPLRTASRLDLRGLAAALDSSARGGRGPGGEPERAGPPDQLRSGAPAARSLPVVPPWLQLLRGERDPAPESGLLLYRRARPFDPPRLRRWLADPPKELVRGKGHVWLASELDRSFGYSCAGSVHRLFPAGRWWASCADGAWPSSSGQRRRLLERWHPRFGDRRQEIVFAGVDLDPDRLCAGLDACLVPEEALDASLPASSKECPEPLSPSIARIH